MTPLDLKDAVDEASASFIIVYKKHSDYEYDFRLQGRKKIWNVRLLFSSDFPFSLPSVELLDKELIGSIPHVNIDGTVCIQGGDSLLVDYHRPTALISYTLEQTISVLSKGDLKIYQDELTDEYEGYFESGTSKVNSFYAAKDEVEHIYLKVIYPSRKERKYSYPVLLFDKNKYPPKDFSNLNAEYVNQIIKAIHIPFTSPALPPQAGQTINLKYVIELLNDVTDKAHLNKLLAKTKKKKQHYLLISFPRSIEGERSQILLGFKSEKSNAHPLVDKLNEWDITTFLLTRNNQSYLIERGGAENNLSNKKITIIGCGSVGGEVAVMLAKSGVGELTLIDNDTLEADNIYRHRLGGGKLPFVPDLETGVVPRYTKTSALVVFLKNEIPYVKVNGVHKSIQEVIKDNEFYGTDVVIVAVGSPSLSLWINRNLKKLGHKKVIFCWNEASSLGGHSVSINFDSACFECLFTNKNGFSLENDLGFLEIGQNIIKNLTGCAGVFTPFSYLDSSQTAALATKQCLDMLLLEKDSIAVSWKGENRDNLKVTKRYEESALKEEYIIKSKNTCHVCQ